MILVILSPSSPKFEQTQQNLLKKFNGVQALFTHNYRIKIGSNVQPSYRLGATF